MSAATKESFQKIKSFILQCGDRQTYCNMYNDNPHYQFSQFEVFLHPDVGQRNIGCEPSLSDFNKLVIRDFREGTQYFDVLSPPNQDWLTIDVSEREAVERYFSLMLAEIDL